METKIKNNTMPKFNKGDLVSYKGGAEYKPVLKVDDSWWDETGWWVYSLISKKDVKEKYAVAERSLEKRTGKVSEKLFNAKDVRSRIKILDGVY